MNSKESIGRELAEKLGVIPKYPGLAVLQPGTYYIDEPAKRSWWQFWKPKYRTETVFVYHADALHAKGCIGLTWVNGRDAHHFDAGTFCWGAALEVRDGSLCVYSRSSLGDDSWALLRACNSVTALLRGSLRDTVLEASIADWLAYEPFKNTRLRMEAEGLLSRLSRHLQDRTPDKPRHV